MASSAFEQTIAEEYSCRIGDKFSECGQRMFLTDYSKACSAKAVLSLLSGKEQTTFLMLVNNAAEAEVFKSILSPVLGDITVFDTAQAISMALSGVEMSVSSLSANAGKFIEAYPRLIVVKDMSGDNATPDGVFNKILADNKTKSGSYGGEYKRDYCFSDMLAECAYEFVVVDDVYSKIELESDGNCSAGKFDKIDFLGHSYYTGVRNSFERLRAVTSRAKSCVITSDVVADTYAVQLYMALELLHTDVSLPGVRREVEPVAAAFSGIEGEGYDTACDVIVSALTFGKDDEGVLSTCLQRTKGKPQLVPGDISSMRKYLEDKLAYLSGEEIMLRAMYSYKKIKSLSRYPSVADLLDDFSSNYDAMALCFVNMFFENEVKGEMESVLSKPRLHDMSEDELASLYRIFAKYGVYHNLKLASEKIKILRLKRDNSGFEYFSRRYSKNDIEDSHCFSIMGDGSDDAYKCVELQRLSDGRDMYLGFSAPAVIVVNAVTETLLTKISRALPDVSVARNLTQFINLAEGAKKRVLVMDYASFHETPYDFSLGSVVFFDAKPSLNEMKLLLAKASKYCSGSVFVFVTYGNVSGTVMDRLQEELLYEEELVPFTQREISIKHGLISDYTEVIEKINTVYAMFYKIVTHSDNRACKDIIPLINGLIIELGTTATFDEDIMGLDIEYAARMGMDFDAVFANTSSVGGNGESLVTRDRSYSPNGANEESENIELFNVCGKMLMHGCDINTQNCADCPNYKKFMNNDPNALGKSVTRFFENAERYVEKMKALIMEKSGDDIIYGGGEDGAGRTVEEMTEFESEIKGYEVAVKDVLRNLLTIKKSNVAVFHSDYKEVLGIREAVYQTYRKILRKYFKAAMIILNNSTDIVIKELESARNAVKKALTNVNGKA